MLGPLEVIDGGESVDLGGRKQRTILALLVANAAHPVSTDRLILGTYGEEAGDGARRSVQTYVSNLRSRLGDVIVSSGHAYELQLADSTVDSIEFGNRLEVGRSLIADDSVGASQELHAALAMWRGQPFQDVDARSELDLHITQLRELRLVALESRVDADMACGDHRALVGELEALTAEHPFRETFHSQLMVALYRSGRQAEALRAFQRVRQHLAEELGIEVSPELRQLEQRILEHDPTLLLDAGGATELPAAARPSTVPQGLLHPPAVPAIDDREVVETSAPTGAVLRKPTNGAGSDIVAATAAATDLSRALPGGLARPRHRPRLTRLAVFAGMIAAAAVIGAVVAANLTDDGPPPTAAPTAGLTVTASTPSDPTSAASATNPPSTTGSVVPETTTAPPQPDRVADPEWVGTLMVGDGPQAALADELAVWFTLTDDAKIVRIDLATIDDDLAAVETIDEPVGGRPTKPLLHDDKLWVPSRADGIISVVEKDSLDLIETVEVGRRPDTPLFAAGLIWVTARDDFKLVAIDPETYEKRFDNIRLPGVALTPVFSQGGIWVASRNPGTLSRIDAFSGQVTSGDLPIGGTPWPPILVDDEIWIADRAGGDIIVVDPLRREIKVTIPLRARISPPLFVGERVWVSDLENREVVVIDVERHEEIRRVPTGLETTLPAEHNGAFWAADPAAGEIVRIDPVKLEASRPIPIDGSPGVPISAGDYLWVPDSEGSRVTLLTG